jgi:tRNA threonylcarbamoyl adenosine modification protein (Sua5/YciO/YrdC/YwlC family)
MERIEENDMKAAAKSIVVPIVANGVGSPSGAARMAAEILKSGGVIATPTDTIYGLAALAQNAAAVRKLYAIKGRDDKKPIAICVAEIADVAEWGEVSESAAPAIEGLLPGPVTVLLRRNPKLNPEFCPGTTLVGIRIPDHAFIREVCRLCPGNPVALTSANVSAAPSTLAVEEFSSLFPKLDAVFDGGRLSAETDEARLGSTVLNLSSAGVFSVSRPGCALKKTLETLAKRSNLSQADNAMTDVKKK